MLYCNPWFYYQLVALFTVYAELLFYISVTYIHAILVKQTMPRLIWLKLDAKDSQWLVQCYASPVHKKLASFFWSQGDYDPQDKSYEYPMYLWCVWPIFAGFDCASCPYCSGSARYPQQWARLTWWELHRWAWCCSTSPSFALCISYVLLREIRCLIYVSAEFVNFEFKTLM